MVDKYRVHELAKDLNVPSKDVLEVLTTHQPDSQRKYQTALSEKEINLVLDHFTKQKQIDNVNDYLNPKVEEKSQVETKSVQPKPEVENKTSLENKPQQQPKSELENKPQQQPKSELENKTPVATPAVEQKPINNQIDADKKTLPTTSTPDGERRYNNTTTTNTITPNNPDAERRYNNNYQGNRYNNNYQGNRYNNNATSGTNSSPDGERRYNNNYQGNRYNNNTTSGTNSSPDGERRYNNNYQGNRYNNNATSGTNSSPDGERRYNNNYQGNRYNNNATSGTNSSPDGERRYNNNYQGNNYQGNRYNNNATSGTNSSPDGERRYNNNYQGNNYQGNRYNNNATSGTNSSPDGERRYNNNYQGNNYQGNRYNNNATSGTNSSPDGERRYNNNYQGNNYQGNRYNNNATSTTNSSPDGQRRYNNNPTTTTQSGERRYGNNTSQPTGERRYNNYGNQDGGDKRYGQDNRVSSVPKKPTPVTPAKPVAPRPAVPKKQFDGENVHVDMRTSNVDLEKYNEKYEQIATEANKGKETAGPKKQKFNQRFNRKPVLSRREQEAEKMRRLELERQRRQKLEITLPEEISVADLALKLKVQGSEIVKRLMVMGIMASLSQIIDYDTASLVAMEIGAKVEREVVVTIEDRLFNLEEDTTENLQSRCPVVVVMGHVDHGKTSLLDAIRETNVTLGEAGGITQHIGAYQVEINGRPITFLDTPGHEAFTSMRARGAQVTDIAVLVVASDDGIMPQTIEAINHAKAAGVAIIVAINKIDKPAANVEKVKQELTQHSLVPEEWGGDVICVPVSAKTREGIEDLLENILLVAEVKELKANPERLAQGTVIEAKLDKGRGPVATILVQNGTLRTGDVVIAGTSVGRVRVMLNDKNEKIDEAGPSTPVEITGLSEAPSAGDTLNAVEDERLARELVERRRTEAKEEQFNVYQKVTLDNLFSQISEGDIKELPIIVKADVNGSVEAVKQSLEKLSNSEVRVRVIHGAVGAVSESDVMLANASNAIIVGFNVRPDPLARETAERDDVEIRLYRIIYDAINEIESAMKGLLAPKFRDVELGRAEIRTVYKLSSVGTIAGCYVLNGKILRSANIRVVRAGIVVADDKIDSLKRFKDDVKEVATGYECGISLDKFKDLKDGDIFEAYTVEEYRD